MKSAATGWFARLLLVRRAHRGYGGAHLALNEETLGHGCAAGSDLAHAPLSPPPTGMTSTTGAIRSPAAAVMVAMSAARTPAAGALVHTARLFATASPLRLCPASAAATTTTKRRVMRRRAGGGPRGSTGAGGAATAAATATAPKPTVSAPLTHAPGAVVPPPGAGKVNGHGGAKPTGDVSIAARGAVAGMEAERPTATPSPVSPPTPAQSQSPSSQASPQPATRACAAEVPVDYTRERVAASNLLTALRERKRRRRAAQLGEHRRLPSAAVQGDERGLAASRREAATTIASAVVAVAAAVTVEEVGDGDGDEAEAAPSAARANHSLDAGKVAGMPAVTVSTDAADADADADADAEVETDANTKPAAGLSAASTATKTAPVVAEEDAAEAAQTTSRNNRSTKRRAGQPRGRGRKRARRGVTTSEPAAPAVESDTANEHVLPLDSAADVTAVVDANAANVDEAAAELDERIGEPRTAAEEAAIDAAVEAAMAAAAGEGWGNDTAESTAPPEKRARGRRSRKGRSRRASASHAAAATVTSARADTGVEAPLADEGEEETDGDVRVQAVAPPVKSAACSAAAAVVEEGEALEETEEPAFADSWLPSAGTMASRAKQRRRAAAAAAAATAVEGVKAEVDDADAASAAAAAAAPAVEAETADDGAESMLETMEVDEDANTEAEAVVARPKSRRGRQASARTQKALPTSPPADLGTEEPVMGGGQAEHTEAVPARRVQPGTVTAATSAQSRAGLEAVTGPTSSHVPMSRAERRRVRARRVRRLRELLLRQLHALALAERSRRQPGTSADVGAGKASAAAASAHTSVDLPETEVRDSVVEEAAVAPESASNRRCRKGRRGARGRRGLEASAAARECAAAPPLPEDSTPVEAEASSPVASTTASTAPGPVDDTPEVAPALRTVAELDEVDDAGRAAVERLEARLASIESALLQEHLTGVPAPALAPTTPTEEEEEELAAAAGARATRSGAGTLRAKILSGGKRAGGASTAPPPPPTGGGTDSSSSNRKNPLHYPDHREQVLIVFQQLAEINAALGERYKTASYSSAVEQLKRNDAVFKLLPPHLRPVDESVLATCGKKEEVLAFLAKRRYVRDPAQAIPGVGDKLRRKIVEILETGDLEELHTLKQRPLIRAIQELTQVHGFGPRTAVSFYKDYGISSVSELRKLEETHGEGGVVASTPSSGKGSAKKQRVFHLTDAQRLGLRYYEEIQQRLPHSEGRLHEAFLKLKLRRYLGKHYELTVCGSYRRKCPTSGDIDVLITPKLPAAAMDGGDAAAPGAGGKGKGKTKAAGDDAEAEDPLAHSKNALATFVAALRQEGYIEANLAQGPTKFMGICRLRSLSPCAKAAGKKPAGASARKTFLARRIDIRFVDAASYPAALLYFTGSKNFNVVMRAEAIKKNFILNEYGLFTNDSRDAAATSKLHEMISKLSRAQFYSSKSVLTCSAAAAAQGSASGRGAGDDDSDDALDGDDAAADEEGAGDETVKAKTAGGRRKAGAGVMTKEQLAELKAISRKVESARVPVRSERDIFDAIGMTYVAPPDRNI